MSSRSAVSHCSALTVFASLCLALALSVPASADAFESHKQAVDAPNSLNAVSCVPQTIDCVVSDSKGNALYSTSVSATAAATWNSWSGPASPSEAVACPSSSLCVLADGLVEEGVGGTMYYASSLGGAWKEAFEPAFGVVAVSCASTAFCVGAEEAGGFIRYTSKPASEEWVAIQIGSGAMNAVDCLSPTFCAVVDSTGHIHIANSEERIKESAGWVSSDIDGSTALRGVACTATTSCVAVDGSGDVLDLTISGREATASKEHIDGTNSLSAITCTGFTCVTVDGQGNVFVSGNGGGSWTKQYETGTALTSVSCASSALCLTADTTGNVIAFAPVLVAEPPEEPVTGEQSFGCELVVKPGLYRLCGSVNPHSSNKVSYHFAYNKGSSCEGGNTLPGGEVEGQDIEVSTELPDGALQPRTKYTYCLVATNVSGETFGQGLTFQTPLAPPGVTTEAATSVTDTTATLKGQVSPGGEATYYFEYGTSPCEASACGTKTSPEGGPLTGTTQQAASFQLTGLKSNTTYHYWAVAKNSAAPAGVHGEPMEFTTPESAEELAQEKEAKEHEEAVLKLIEEHAKQVAEETTQKEAATKKQQEEAAAATAKKQQEEAVAAATKKQQEEAEVKKKQEEASASPSVTITKVHVTATKITLTLKTSAAGPVTISGPGLKTTTKNLTAGSDEINVTLTKSGKKHHKKIKITVILKATGKTVSVSKTAKL